jgi:Mrp family chromosome partitioning ATPase
VAELYDGKIPIIRHDLNEGFLRGAEAVSTGLVERDYDIDPVEMRDSPMGIQLFDENDWQAIYDRQQAEQSSLIHRYLSGPDGTPAFDFLDQDGFPDCWTHSTGHGLMMDKVVVITGGASGIGRATALAFAREGAKVVIGDVDVKGAQETIEAIRSNGGTGISMCVDVTKAADVQQMITAAVDGYGGLDYAFNNAGFVGSNAGIVETSEEDWHQVMGTIRRVYGSA